MRNNVFKNFLLMKQEVCDVENTFYVRHYINIELSK